MRSSIRRSALRAAAKVALSFPVVGCGGEIAATPRETLTRATDDAATDALTCAVPPGDAAVGQATFDCCMTQLMPYDKPEGGWRAPFPDAAASDPAIAPCCDAIVRHLVHDEHTDSDYAADRLRAAGTGLLWSCCDITTVGQEKEAICIAWGPPVPPEMPKEVA